MCRLYLGLAKLDPETAEEMRKAMPLQRIRKPSPTSSISLAACSEIRDGIAIVPGGARARTTPGPSWPASAPDQGRGVFREADRPRDDGWLASYFDSLARINGPRAGLPDRAGTR